MGPEPPRDRPLPARSHDDSPHHRSARTLAEHEIHEDHGHSVAAWTGVGIILVGSALASLAVAVTSHLLFWVGIAICILGAVAGKVLSLAGYGAKAIDGPDAPDSTKPEVGIK